LPPFCPAAEVVNTRSSGPLAASRRIRETAPLSRRRPQGFPDTRPVVPSAPSLAQRTSDSLSPSGTATVRYASPLGKVKPDPALSCRSLLLSCARRVAERPDLSTRLVVLAVAAHEDSRGLAVGYQGSVRPRCVRSAPPLGSGSVVMRQGHVSVVAHAARQRSRSNTSLPDDASAPLGQITLTPPPSTQTW
jgi:hypothetical protein